MADDTLRPAVEADLESLLVLNNAAVPAVNALDAAEMAWFAEVAHLFLVADSPKGPVGFLIGLEGPDLSYRSLNYQWFARNYGLLSLRGPGGGRPRVVGPRFGSSFLQGSSRLGG